jgi:enoyl-CoA hydratase/carnithine racemase
VISSKTYDDIVVVKIDRPEGRNAMVPELLQALVEHLRVAGAHRQPIVLTATGSTFCPGADLNWLADCPNPELGVADLVAAHHLAIATLLDMPVPVIAALNGSVAGGGLGLALAGDYRIAAQRATFIAAYFKLGLTPDGGSSAFLERMIGPARTLEMLLTNRPVTAREALGWGLVHEVVDDAHLLERAVAFAHSLPVVPSYALLQTRRLLDATNIRNQMQLESVAIRAAARGEFFRQALQAFKQHGSD